MKLSYILLLFLFIAACFSCIQDEPLSPYADITAFSLPENVRLSNATINQTNISVMVRKTADLSSIVPSIEISEGATIHPEIGTSQDFSKNVQYTVTAADGKHQRTFTVQAISIPVYSYDFENWEALNSSRKYETPVEYNESGLKMTIWDSSNKGTAIYWPSQTPASEYPIRRTETHATGRYAAEMTTQEGPGDIIFVNIPIVAGSLFTGVLNPLNAIANPLLATEFGQPVMEKPLLFKGQYIYKPGTGSYIDSKGKDVPGKKDTCAVYSVFFRSDEKLERLDGTNILTHPNIVAIAMMPPEMKAGSEGDDFNAFEIPFEYKTGHVVDFTKNRYKLAVIFSSSFNGDLYEGAIGSRLVVDDVLVVVEDDAQKTLDNNQKQ